MFNTSLQLCFYIFSDEIFNSPINSPLLCIYIFSDEIFNSPINSHENLEETVWSENVAYERASLYKPNKPQVRNGMVNCE